MMTLETKLEDLRRHFEDEGSLPALFEAIHWCHANERPLPEWAVVGACNAVIFQYNERNGRTPDHYADYIRWRGVRHLLQVHGLDSLPTGRGRPRKGDATPTKDAILDAAARYLKANKQRFRLSRMVGSKEMLERSFREVERSRAAGEYRYRFEDLLTLP